jgi:hypothetical protein
MGTPSEALDAVPVLDHSHRRPWRAVYADAASMLSVGSLAGLVCGALVGGVGGRLAMFILRLTSDDALHGLATDDGFTIGAFTAATVFLVLFAALLGAVGGLVYLGARERLPARWRPLLFGLFGATVGGALFIHPDGTDFTLLEPLWLAVALFVLLPAAYGVALSLLTERLLRATRWQRSRWRWVALLPAGLALLALGLSGLGVLLLSGLLIGATRSDRVVALWRSVPVTWLGRAAFVAALGIGGVVLARAVAAIL